MGFVPKVAVMVLNFNGRVWLERCLSSLLKLEYPNLDIHLIDNGSSDGSVDYVRSAFPMVSVTAYPENLGYAEGYNVAIRNVKADYVLLLNNDTEIVSPRLVDDLVEALEADRGIAAASCKILFMSEPDTINSIGGTGIRFWRGFADAGFGEKDEGQYDEPPVEPFSVCGGAALIRRDLYLSVGGFDSRFFAYSEDVDLCWRLRLLGYRVCYVPKARVLHHFSGSLPPSNMDRLKLLWTRRNLLRMIIKNCDRSTLGWALRSVLAHLCAMLMWFSLTDPTKAICLARAVAWNITNLKDTLRERRRIQLRRLALEGKILAVMYQPFQIRQGRQHPRLSRLADIIFGRGWPSGLRLDRCLSSGTHRIPGEMPQLKI